MAFIVGGHSVFKTLLTDTYSIHWFGEEWLRSCIHFSRVMAKQHEIWLVFAPITSTSPRLFLSPRQEGEADAASSWNAPALPVSTISESKYAQVQVLFKTQVQHLRLTVQLSAVLNNSHLLQQQNNSRFLIIKIPHHFYKKKPSRDVLQGRGCSAISQDVFVRCHVSRSVQRCRVGVPFAAFPTELLIFIKIFCKCLTRLALLSNV